MGSHVSDISFKYSLKQLVLLTLGAAFATVGCAYIAMAGLVPQGSFKGAVIWFGVLFFSLGTFIGAWRLFDRDPVLEISETGIWDKRLSSDIIPWTAMTGLSQVSIKSQKFLMVRLDPAFERTMKKTRLSSWGKPANAAMGLHGYPISMAGLTGSFDDLVAAIQSFRRP